MKIAIHGRNFNEDVKPHIEALFATLAQREAEVQISDQFASFLEKNGIRTGRLQRFSHYRHIFDADFMISIGGDGTLLETVAYVGARETPILGINTGRLGFLATTAPGQIADAVNSLYNNYFTLEERSLIHLDTDRELFDGLSFGLNEFTITKRDTASMIVVHTYIDGEYLNSYWADGLIVATPTGSTGYSLSCGGPVVLPQSGNFIISPVSPHNLNVRPLVVSDNSVISFEIQGRSKNYLVSLDSRSRVVDASIGLAVRKESFRARLVQLDGNNFLQTLRNKLNWGLDVRN
jgi:NAD+ kinase